MPTEAQRIAQQILETEEVASLSGIRAATSGKNRATDQHVMWQILRRVSV